MMEQQNDLKEWGKKMAAIGVVGVLLVGGLSAVIFGPPVDKEVQAGALLADEWEDSAEDRERISGEINNKGGR